MEKRDRKGLIRHAGVVDSVTEDVVRVRIVQSSSCASCEVSGSCRISEAREKLVEVVSASANYHVGQPVVVTVSRRAGIHSVILAFGIPFILLLLTVFCVWTLTKEESVSALASLGMLALYYGVLFLFRQRIAKNVTFNIEEIK